MKRRERASQAEEPFQQRHPIDQSLIETCHSFFVIFFESILFFNSYCFDIFEENFDSSSYLAYNCKSLLRILPHLISLKDRVHKSQMNGAEESGSVNCLLTNLQHVPLQTKPIC